MSWVKLNDLSGAGSSVLTLETTGGAIFDGIVYAERTANQWMAGSNNWFRTPGNNGGAAETSTALQQLAIVYKADNSITLYRNGLPYGTPYTQGSLITYSGSNLDVIFGWRHTGGGGSTINAEIEDARIYAGALTSTDLAALVPNVIPEPAGVALLTLGAILVIHRRRD